jgi:hypothetical protein
MCSTLIQDIFRSLVQLFKSIIYFLIYDLQTDVIQSQKKKKKNSYGIHSINEIPCPSRNEFVYPINNLPNVNILKTPPIIYPLFPTLK